MRRPSTCTSVQEFLEGFQARAITKFLLEGHGESLTLLTLPNKEEACSHEPASSLQLDNANHVAVLEAKGRHRSSRQRERGGSRMGLEKLVSSRRRMRDWAGLEEAARDNKKPGKCGVRSRGGKAQEAQGELGSAGCSRVVRKAGTLPWPSESITGHSQGLRPKVVGDG